MLKSIRIALLLAIVPLARLHAANQLSEYETKSGWQLLFDGQNISQWRNYRKHDVSDGWRIQNDALTCSRGAGDLITQGKYDNFELSIEYKIAPGGNSGLLFHVTEEGVKAWHSGPEVQLLDNQRHRAKEKSGWLYQLYKPVVPGWSIRAREAAGLPAPSEVDATRPAGEWNHIYLRVCEAQSEVVLNGVGYFRFRKGDTEWNERVANSKFAKFPYFGKASSGHICLQEHGSQIAFRNIKVRQLDSQGNVLQQPVDGKLDLVGEVAFPQLEWEGWEPIDDNGLNQPLRLMELTHAGDQRLFAVAQRGQIFAFDNDPGVQQSQLFLDITDRVAPWRKHNEEGLLGLAFHPNFKDNGYFYVYYSAADKVRTSRISRFQTVDGSPNLANPKSEVVLLEIDQPFHNHNGGAIEFGPDGYLYVGMGDGGDRNDPFSNGQDVSTLLGSILRIDVNREENGKPYAIPPNNPFVGQSEKRPEIFAFGFRNIWRMAFEPNSNRFWVADVGQDLWEEINLVERGGNYGWNIREGEHPFGNSTIALPNPVEPIWQYDHRIGKSITGGRVYTNSRLPELHGKYLYADYVSGRIWALEYNHRDKKVIRNMEISSGGITVTAFGEDAEGEVYYMIPAPNGQCIYRFSRR